MSVDLENVNISGLQSGGSVELGKSCLYCPGLCIELQGSAAYTNFKTDLNKWMHGRASLTSLLILAVIFKLGEGMEAFSRSDPISAKTHGERKISAYQINFWLAMLPYKFSIIPILIPSNCVVTQINPMQLMDLNALTSHISVCK